MGRSKDKKAIAIAKYLQRRFVGMGYVVHRYDAFSTGSIYLKIDYGVGGSIRIADHAGKKHLNYRFNILTDEDGAGVSSTTDGVCDRHFYKAESAERLLNDVIKFRDGRVNKYGGTQGYTSIMNKAKEENRGSKGFWMNAREIKISRAELVKDWLLRNEITYEEMDIIVENLKRNNEKLADTLRNTKDGWRGLTDKLLDLVVIRYKEMKQA